MITNHKLEVATMPTLLRLPVALPVTRRGLLLTRTQIWCLKLRR